MQSASPEDFKIFLGNLSKCYSYGDLDNFFKKIAPSISIDIPDSFSISSKNPGYCYITCETMEDAEDLIFRLRGCRMDNRPIHTALRKDSCSLWISSVPSNMESNEIEEKLSQMSPGLMKIDIRKAQTAPYFLYAILTYKTHQDASCAFMTFSKKSEILGQSRVTVNWARSRKNFQREFDNFGSSTLYIGKLDPGVTKVMVADAFQKLFENEEDLIDSIRFVRDFAFITFRSPDLARTALKSVDSAFCAKIQQAPLRVHWAYPTRRKYSLSSDYHSSQAAGSPTYGFFDQPNSEQNLQDTMITGQHFPQAWTSNPYLYPYPTGFIVVLPPMCATPFPTFIPTE